MNDSYVRGFLIGKEIMNMFVPKKQEPIAYLYNGVRLPALPEWDREKYPYVFLTKQMLAGFGGIADYELRVVSKPTYTHASNGNYVVCYEGYYEYFEGEGWKELKQTSGSIHPDYIKWANFDITDENGAVVLAKSDPIPIYNEPVNYLYNGVQLPKLPEWDKTVYPYAVLVRYGTSTIPFLWCNNVKFATFADGTTGMDAPFDAFKLSDGEWVDHNAGGIGYTPFWTNTDIYYGEASGGGLFLEASEPIPIYE